MFKRYARAEAPAAPSIDAPTEQEVEAQSRRSDRKSGAPAPTKEASEAKLRERKRQDKLLDVRMDLHKKLLETLNLTVLDKATEQDLRREISIISGEGLREMGVVLNSAETDALIGELYDEVTGLGPLEPLLKDDTINDILVNSADQIFVERAGKLELTNVRFRDEKHLLRVIDKIVSAVGRRVDESNPYVDARLTDGSRFNAMVPPCAVDGSLVSIRKFKKDKLNIDELIEFGAFNEDMATYLQAAVARIVTIEDTAELQLQQVHVGRMESRPPNVEGKGEVTQRDLLRNALRMRPDRIIVGETRGDEVIDMLQAMNTGHDGSMTTIHANSARDSVARLENMIAMTGVEMPLKATRAQISSAVNLIVQVSRLQDGSRRMVSITELTGMEGEIISMQEIFKFERTGLGEDGKIIGHFTSTGLRSSFSERFAQWGYDLPASIYSQARNTA